HRAGQEDTAAVACGGRLMCGGRRVSHAVRLLDHGIDDFPKRNACIIMTPPGVSTDSIRNRRLSTGVRLKHARKIGFVR
ncbi:MAG: hypothetical protein O7D94_01930, partial [Planctomycetota bacterium]|nr:hypothetical protein [Planctomycetota bacterium]